MSKPPHTIKRAATMTALAFALACPRPGHAEDPAPKSVAILNFELDDTSLQGSMQGADPTAAERLAKMPGQLAALLDQSGIYHSLPVSADIQKKADDANLLNCGDCDLALAKEAGAQVSVVGWVQKVSNLILNINVRMRDVDTGRLLAGGSVDIRGNTDESWERGLSYLARNTLLPQSQSQAQ